MWNNGLRQKVRNSMERLTRRSANGTGVYATPSGEPVKWENNRHNVLQKLADYEDLEEQGRLIKLPCKAGDTVYVVTSPFNVFDDIEYDENTKDEVYESYVSSTTFYKSGEQYRIYAKATNHFIGAYFRECDFGKTVFLTKSEAEAKLKELRGGENE
nr:MAG TPA: hypothetical protein [Caudoviricetes sp.]